MPSEINLYNKLNLTRKMFAYEAMNRRMVEQGSSKKDIVYKM
jgi:hypothetical protein